ncbi:hypothetical protein LOTGIDRAFT_128222 [Lottia gigantea]|uniref:15-hydroxyprostaglandin dehydrogenase [NAD(+)] n=1 Tax=Lottia gigantea TaxID=225164 RepID=V3ZRK8_LOTGI|nr:hypothetical protein LOTGIDRAFT_128222 [Lottia gigantea]ESO86972.1 hypothetical protein LOTGIDRAFT_128222 [Lottia gigantea]
MNLSGKVALVTGAAQGLGKAFSESLLSQGAKVCLADVKVQQGKTTAAEFQKTFGNDSAFFEKCDVSIADDVTNVFKKVKSKYGQIDILVNNAGIANETHWRKMVDINLVSVIQGTQLGIEYMSKEYGGNGGVIINVSSSAGLVPVFITPVYCAVKFGVVGFTRSVAVNPRNRSTSGIRFCCLCPAFTDTDIIKFKKDSGINMKYAPKILKSVGINK